MTVLAAEPVLGSQSPTHRLCPPQDFTLGHEAIGLAEMVGLTLDEYQRNLLIDGLGAIYDGGKPGGWRWSAREVAIELSRQNGKSVVLQVAALAALFLFDARKIVYSAHEGQTALDAFEAIESLIKGCPELYVRVRGGDRGFRHGNGKESITLSTGQTILFRTRTAGGGRGLSGDLVILDEAQALKPSHIRALFPTLRARPKPQLWYAGSAGDQDSEVLGRLVRRCTQGAKGLCMYRWAVDEDDDPGAVSTWAKANPGLGTRIDLDWMAGEFDAMDLASFSQELLGMGDYPREDGEDWVIPAAAVKACVDRFSVALGPVVFAADAMPNQDYASVAIAGVAGTQLADGTLVAGRQTPDAAAAQGDGHGPVTLTPGAVHGEIIEHRRGVRWIPQYLAKKMLEHPNVGVVIDPKGPLGRLVPELTEMGLTVHLIESANDVADACGWVYDAMTNEPRLLQHRGAPELLASIAGAAARDLAGGFAWRRHGKADISPLYALTFAARAASKGLKPAEPPPSPVKAGRQPPRRTPPTRQPPARAGRPGRQPVTGETADVGSMDF